MESLNQIFLDWTSVILPDTILLSFSFVIVALIIFSIIDVFK